MQNLTKFDILRKDFRYKKIEQITTTTVLGGQMVSILEFKEEDGRLIEIGLNKNMTRGNINENRISKNQKLQTIQ